MFRSFNEQLLASREATSFAHQTPCPWTCFSGMLEDTAFEALNAEFPARELFEKHQGMTRSHGQRPHNRYYLALEKSNYENKPVGTPGCVRYADLSPHWQHFIHELQSSDSYLSFVRRALEVEQVQLRFAWHVAGAGDDVSPHCDSASKVGTHLFYFNTSDDWREEWGGGTVFLRGKKNNAPNPELTDFEAKETAPILDNRCLLFKNAPEAWHGVEPLRCPTGHYRRVFNVIFEFPKKHPLSIKPSFLLSRLKRGLLGGLMRS